jgi:hypothetical protein
MQTMLTLMPGFGAARNKFKPLPKRRANTRDCLALLFKPPLFLSCLQDCNSWGNRF